MSAYAIGAAGSGELEAVAKPAETRYLGKEVDYMVGRMEARYAALKKEMATFAVMYPADGTAELSPSSEVFWAFEEMFSGVDSNPIEMWRNEPGVQKYMKSITTGVSVMSKEAEGLAKACPSSRIVLFGYSQGAIVAHDVAVALTKRKVHIYSVVLLADGDRQPNEREGYLSASSAGEGIRPWLKEANSGSIPAGPKVFQLCDAEDLICDMKGTVLAEYLAAGALLGGPVGVVAEGRAWFKHVTGIHTGYLSNTTDKKMMATIGELAGL